MADETMSGVYGHQSTVGLIDERAHPQILQFLCFWMDPDAGLGEWSVSGIDGVCLFLCVQLRGCDQPDGQGGQELDVVCSFHMYHGVSG